MNKKSNILIVDDEPEICKYLKKMLVGMNYNVKTCHNGKDVLKYLTIEKFDLILLDIVLEDINGFQVLEALSQHNIDTAVIVITGYASTDSAVKAFKMGAYDYLKKPFQSDELFISVKNALKMRQLKKDNDAFNRNCKKNETRYRELFESTNNGVVVYEVIDKGRDFIFKDFNRAGEKIDKCKREDLIGKSIFEVRPGVEQFGLIEVFRQVWQTGKPAHHPVTLYQDKDLKSWYENYVYKLSSNEIVAVFQNVTERKQMVNELKHINMRMQLAAESAGFGVWDWDITKNKLVWDQRMFELFGKDPDKFKGEYEDWANCVHPDDWERVKGDLQHILYEEKKGELRYRIVLPTGPVRYIKAPAVVMRDCDGNPVRLTGINFDITHQELAKNADRQQKQYLNGLHKAAQVLLLAKKTIPFQEFLGHLAPASNADRVYVFINSHDLKGDLLMSQKAEWHAKGIIPEINNVLLQNLSYDKFVPRLKEILIRGDLYQGRVADFPENERKILESQGILAILIVPIIINGEFFGFIGFDRCTSDHTWSSVERTFLAIAAKDLALTIKRMRFEDLLHASAKEKDVLLREIHHRVKNNMQSINSLLKIHARQIDDARLGKVLDDCQARISAMSLIHEALYQSEKLAKIDFKNYLKKLCHNLSLAHGASKKGIVVTVKQCNIILNIDQGIVLGMIIAELISNSFKYAFDKDQGGNIWVTLSNVNGDSVELIVQDDGKGIPKEIDIHNSPSFGLKLVVAAVTRELGGDINVEQNSGTRFVIGFKAK